MLMTFVLHFKPLVCYFIEKYSHKFPEASRLEWHCYKRTQWEVVLNRQTTHSNIHLHIRNLCSCLSFKSFINNQLAWWSAGKLCDLTFLGQHLNSPDADWEQWTQKQTFYNLFLYRITAALLITDNTDIIDIIIPRINPSGIKPSLCLKLWSVQINNTKTKIYQMVY